ncbi:hypothetical protein B0E43_08775 [Algoriphagus sp. A40]|nr:hypothetical protein B0E43_08775 [Algoriphagus sp. A40]
MVFRICENLPAAGRFVTFSAKICGIKLTTKDAKEHEGGLTTENSEKEYPRNLILSRTSVLYLFSDLFRGHRGKAKAFLLFRLCEESVKICDFFCENLRDKINHEGRQGTRRGFNHRELRERIS